MLGMLKRTLRLVLVCALLSVPASSMAEERIIGHWVDKVGATWLVHIKIVENGSGYAMVSTFKDGSSRHQELAETQSTASQRQAFVVPGDDHGSWYAIDRAGNLKMYDREGFVRDAKPAK